MRFIRDTSSSTPGPGRDGDSRDARLVTMPAPPLFLECDLCSTRPLLLARRGFYVWLSLPLRNFPSFLSFHLRGCLEACHSCTLILNQHYIGYPYNWNKALFLPQLKAHSNVITHTGPDAHAQCFSALMGEDINLRSRGSINSSSRDIGR